MFKLSCINFDYIKEDNNYIFNPKNSKSKYIIIEPNSPCNIKFDILTTPISIIVDNKKYLYNSNTHVNFVVNKKLIISNKRIYANTKIILSNIKSYHIDSDNINNKNIINNNTTSDTLIYLFIQKNDFLEIVENYKNHLLDIGLNPIIITNIPIKYNDNDLFIIITDNAKNIKNLPKKYIFYQINQLIKDNIPLISNCERLFDISIHNLNKYKDITKKKVYIQILPYYYKIDNNNYNNTIYDIFVYGIKTNKKVNIINNLLQTTKLNIIYDEIIENHDDNIQKSKIILYIEDQTNKIIDVTKIYDLLKYNKIIIYEKTISNDNMSYEMLKDIVIFIDEIKAYSKTDKLIENINYYLEDDNYNNYINRLEKQKDFLHNKSKYIIHKNLLGLKNINLDKFIPFDINSNEINCVHVFETPNRLEDFKKQNYQPKVNIYPAIKYNPGWVGCGLSHRNLVWNAKRLGLDRITICEDDCCYKQDFEEKYKIINEFLDKHGNWDLFNGCIGNLPKDTTFGKFYRYKGIIFLEINKMHHAVFNIHNKTGYDKILKWNENKLEPTKNQIDQYMRDQELKIITTYPYEFCCTNSTSAIWNRNFYEHYEETFKKSLEFIKSKIDKLEPNSIIEIE